VTVTKDQLMLIFFILIKTPLHILLCKKRQDGLFDQYQRIRKEEQGGFINQYSFSYEDIRIIFVCGS
jgi:hypothetical protein